MNRNVLTALVLVHLFASLWHGGAHDLLAIDMPAAKDAYIYLVIVLAPLAGVAMLWTSRAEAGLWICVASMLGAVLFGVYHHYVMVSPDNIAHLPTGPAHVHSRFINSAAVIALLELATAVYAAFGLGSERATER